MEVITENPIKRYGQNPSTILAIPILTIYLVFILYHLGNSIDGEVQSNFHTNYVHGISHALESFSMNYSTDNKNLERLSNGYLNADDPEHYETDTNELEVDNDKAMKCFLEILSGSINQPVSEIQKTNLNVIKIYTTYLSIGTTTVVKYHVQVLRPNGTNSSIKICNSEAEVQNYIDSYLGVKTDISIGFIDGVHKAQKYDRKNEYRKGNVTVSSYDTYICVAKDIVAKGRYFRNTKFNEIQTYSTGRIGVNSDKNANFN